MLQLNCIIEYIDSSSKLGNGFAFTAGNMCMHASMLSIQSPSSVTHCIRRANIFFRTAVFRDLEKRNMLLKSMLASIKQNLQCTLMIKLATEKLSLQSPERDP